MRSSRLFLQNMRRDCAPAQSSALLPTIIRRSPAWRRGEGAAHDVLLMLLLYRHRGDIMLVLVLCGQTRVWKQIASDRYFLHPSQKESSLILTCDSLGAVCPLRLTAATGLGEVLEVASGEQSRSGLNPERSSEREEPGGW